VFLSQLQIQVQPMGPSIDPDTTPTKRVYPKEHAINSFGRQMFDVIFTQLPHRMVIWLAGVAYVIERGGVEMFSGIVFALVFHRREEWLIEQAYRFVEFGCFWALLPLFIRLVKYSSRDWLDYGKQRN